MGNKKVQRLINHAADQLARRSGFSSGREYLAVLARKKHYELKGLLQKLSKTIATAMREGRTPEEWSEHQWATLFARVESLKKSRRATAATHTPHQNNYQGKGDEEGFAAYIAFRLEQLGKPASWLAKKAGISKQAVSYYLHRRHEPRPSLRAKIVKILEPEE